MEYQPEFYTGFFAGENIAMYNAQSLNKHYKFIGVSNQGDLYTAPFHSSNWVIVLTNTLPFFYYMYMYNWKFWGET